MEKIKLILRIKYEKNMLMLELLEFLKFLLFFEKNKINNRVPFKKEQLLF